MTRNLVVELFMKPEIANLRREIVSRVDALRLEMASAVRLLGDDAATAKEATHIAARKTGLPARLIERLRYKKIGRIAADVADTIREAVAAYQARQEALARHEIIILTARLQSLESRLCQTDPDFFCEEAVPAIRAAYGEGAAFSGPRGAAGSGTDGALEALNGGERE